MDKIVVDAVVGYIAKPFAVRTYGVNGEFETEGYAHDDLSKIGYGDNQMFRAKVTIEFVEE